MANVFVVQHESDQKGASDVKFIGVFSSKEAAEAAVDELRLRAGFSNAPDGFSIDTYEVDRVHWAEGFLTK